MLAINKSFRLVIDTACEVYELIAPYADGEFWDFEQQGIHPNTVYLIGRLEMERCQAKIRSIIQNESAKIVFSNPYEGSETLLGQFWRMGIDDLVREQRIMVLGGGDIEPGFRHVSHDLFLCKMDNFDENMAASQRWTEVYTKTNKPYSFLFLNGRMRPHRKWLLERFRDVGLLDRSLYTNLHAASARVRWLKYMHNGEDLMARGEPLHFLPEQYEVDRYRDQVGVTTEDRNIKQNLFKNEWGDVYINPQAYIDTYFSVVTETVFNYPYSFRTEKIWKPIMMAHPWIAVTNAGFYRDMRDLGFRTFSGIIDESFDSIQNPQQRIERIAQVVQDLCQQDLWAFLTACQDVCKYNQHHMLELAKQTRREFAQRFITFVEQNIQ